MVKHQDDVIKWKQFPRYWPFVSGIHRSPVDSPHKGQWRGALMVSLICAWTNGWANTRDAGDLRRHEDHYDVVAMIIQTLDSQFKDLKDSPHHRMSISWVFGVDFPLWYRNSTVLPLRYVTIVPGPSGNRADSNPVLRYYGMFAGWQVVGRVPFINSSPPRQHGRHFADDIFRCNFVNEKFCILIQISMKFVPNGPIDDMGALVQVMAWHRIGDNPLPEPMLTPFTDACMWH